MKPILVLEKYTPAHGRSAARERPPLVHVRGWSNDRRTKPKVFGSGETGFIMAGHAADAASRKGVEVRYRGRWTPHERRGPWSVNKAMRGE